ncbi:MAG: hypothetical protein ACLR4Z_02205 [Butyricicoccaceae bacterium]
MRSWRRDGGAARGGDDGCRGRLHRHGGVPLSTSKSRMLLPQREETPGRTTRAPMLVDIMLLEYQRFRRGGRRSSAKAAREGADTLTKAPEPLG